ncbi:MAG TPA: carbonic anhydrase family protein [Segetibacter sp.]|jgi:carbonic anhydrase|nr:carbonic anhydrase family protein [Segetibacter sp.]
MKTLTKELQAAITPRKALELLKEGNQRFVENKKLERDLVQQARETANGQYPFAVILSCIDSRTSSELIFDLGIGDVFNARIAGNIINQDILGSMEFACKLAGSKLIVVLGHTKCGAVKGACDHAQLGNLTALVAKIERAAEEERTVTENRNSGNAEFVEKVSTINVKRTVQAIMDQSPILKEMIDNGEIGIVGGMHDIATGIVQFYDDTSIVSN